MKKHESLPHIVMITVDQMRAELMGCRASGRSDTAYRLLGEPRHSLHPSILNDADLHPGSGHDHDRA